MSQLSTLLEQGLTPDVIEEIEVLPEGTTELTYIGYFKNGNPQKAIIKKIEKIGTTTTVTYPNGQFDFIHNWDDRDTYSYAYKK